MRRRLRRTSSSLPPPQRGGASTWWWLVLVLAGSVTYFNALGAPPVIDDVESIERNERIRQLWNPDVLMPERELPIAGRPLVNLTLAVNYAIHGLDITGYRVVNLIFHLLCAVLVFAVVHRGLRLPTVSARWPVDAAAVASGSSLIWLLHPLNSEVVNYITQRTEAMMALAYLVTLYAAMRALDGNTRRWAAVSIGACALGSLCKESMATAPLMVVLFDRVFVYRKWSDAWRSRRHLYLGLMASWLVVAAVLATRPRTYSTGFNVGVSAWTYLLNQAVMITRYLRLAFWPDALVVYYGFPQPLALGDVLPQFLLVVAMLLATIIALRLRPWLGFAGAWLFITLAPTSSVVPIATEVGAERRMYLPLLAIVVPLCIAAVRAIRGTAARVSILVAVSLALALVTAARNREYLDPVMLAELTHARWPTAVSSHLLGEQLLIAGRYEAAEPLLRAATRGAPRAHFTLGVLLQRTGRLDEAIDELHMFIQRRPLLLEVPEAHVTIAGIHASRQRWDPAVVELRSALAKAPRHTRAWRLLADVYVEQEKAGDAVRAYVTYLRLEPGDVDAWTNLGVCLAAEARLAEAIEAFRRTVELRPADGQTHRNLATALLDAGLVEEASRAARRAVELRPNDQAARDLLASALARR